MLPVKLTCLTALLLILSACGQGTEADGQNENGTTAPAAAPQTATLAATKTTPSSTTQTLRQRLETPRANDVMVIAHRSCWHKAPENSLASMQACIDMGVDMIEVDVRTSADGVLVVMHDETVDRTTNGTGRIDELTLEQLKTLHLKENEGGPDAKLTDQKIPTLDEALDTVEGKILVNLDTKGQVLIRAMQAVTERGMGKQILFKSTLPPDDTTLRSMRRPEGSYFMPVVREANGPLAKQVSDFQWANPIAFEVVFQSDSYLEAGAKAVTGSGVRLWVNTLWEGLAGNHTDEAALTDPDSNWGYVIDQGTTMIQTDYPSQLIKYLEGRGLR
jgi:glycerophosphoryl diester phosphodiesterase